MEERKQNVHYHKEESQIMKTPQKLSQNLQQKTVK